MSTNVSGKLWGGRFSQPMNQLVADMNASLPFDRRMARQDIVGSMAHATMLGRQGIISTEDSEAIIAGLGRVLAEIEDGAFVFDNQDEDIHMAVEKRLTALIGAPAGRLHTARSRNDQVALDVRLWMREALALTSMRLLDAAEAALNVGDRYADAIMPGYTHTQRGQPVLVAHHLHAWATMLLRDVERLGDVYKRVNVNPLGGAAMAGATWPIDPFITAELLGMPALCANSMDAIGDRDHVIETLAALSIISMHLSRIAEELVLWTTAEYGFAELGDAFTTGSSIMPQKKNADIAELMRGKTGRVYGALVSILTITKALPLTYNKDNQEDKEGMFDAFDTILMLLQVLPPMLDTLVFFPETLAKAAIGGFSLATDIADQIAKRGLPFREAHEISGRLVARCIREGRTLESLSAAEWAEVSNVFTDGPPDVTLLGSVSARNVPGGTAPNRVADAYVASRAQIVSERERVAALLATETELHARLDAVLAR